MPIHEMTQNEVEGWLGNGIIMPGPKPQAGLKAQPPQLDDSVCMGNVVNGGVSQNSTDKLVRHSSEVYEQAISQLAVDKGLTRGEKQEISKRSGNIPDQSYQDSRGE
jgi:hypothetical protein